MLIGALILSSHPPTVDIMAHSCVTATDKAVGLPELLEAILLQVDICKLFTLQRICRAWRVQIRASKSLQVKMWLSSPLPIPSQAQASTINALVPSTFRVLIGPDLMAPPLESSHAMYYPLASWRRMLLFVPPLPRASIKLKSETTICKNRRGLTLADLWMAVDEAMDEVMPKKIWEFKMRNARLVEMGKETREFGQFTFRRFKIFDGEVWRKVKLE